MGDYLYEVLRIAPITWTGNSYTSCNYVTIEIDSSTDEYQEIVDALRSENDNYIEGIEKIERVQHPFAYGRFILRKEQFIKRNGNCDNITRYFLMVEKLAMSEALEYNMDKRRTPYIVLNSYRSRDPRYCVVIVKSLKSVHSIDRDCDMYPEYVIYYDS